MTHVSFWRQDEWRITMCTDSIMCALITIRYFLLAFLALALFSLEIVPRSTTRAAIFNLSGAMINFCKAFSNLSQKFRSFIITFCTLNACSRFWTKLAIVYLWRASHTCASIKNIPSITLASTCSCIQMSIRTTCQTLRMRSIKRAGSTEWNLAHTGVWACLVWCFEVLVSKTLFTEVFVLVDTVFIRNMVNITVCNIRCAAELIELWEHVSFMVQIVLKVSSCDALLAFTIICTVCAVRVNSCA